MNQPNISELEEGSSLMEKAFPNAPSAAAHDLHSSLENILIMAGLLREQPGGPLNEVQSNVIGQICDNARFMTQMLNRHLADTFPYDEILTLSRGNLEELVQDIVNDHRYHAGTRSISMNFQISGMIPNVIMDDDRIREALDHLLRNAVEHSPDATAVEVRLSAYGSRAIIEVIDEGPGMSIKQLDRLFSPSHRGSLAKHDGQLPCAMGLSVTRRIIEAHRGEIHAMNRPGGGLAIRIFLPISTHSSG